MQIVAAVSFTLLVVCAWGVGVRLLLLARRTHGLPETCLGWTMVCLMGIGYPVAVAAQAESVLGVVPAKLAQNLSNAFINIAFALTYVFTWRVFRPKSTAALTFTLLAFATLVTHWLVIVRIVYGLESMADSIDATRHWALLSLVPGGIGYAWTAIESFRYRGLLKRRMALGLADPVIANRFLLWGFMGLATAASALVNVGFLLTHVDVVSSPIAQSMTSMTGVVQSALLYLTFLPPERYTRWLQGDAPARG
jgi:hypothetical protein